MPLSDQIHSDSPSPVPSIPSLRRENPMDMNPFATVPSIVTPAGDPLPFETDWCSNTDSERDFSCFVTDPFENCLFTDHLHALSDLDRDLDQFTNSANEWAFSGFGDNGEIESTWSTFAVESDSMLGSDSMNSGLRAVDMDSDTGIIDALQFVTGDDGENDVNWEESPNPPSENLSFCIHQRISFDDFEWEEVVEERADERENSSLVVDGAGAEELSLASGFSNDEDSSRWEILLVMDDLGRNTNWEEDNYDEVSIAEQDDYMYAAEYDSVIGQLVENEITLKGSPPAAKTAVENLPLVDLKAENNRFTEEVCAVCKDKFSMEEKVRKLPCCHYYHDDCILPWLDIRNTCPVCRYELPTDDPEYERRNSRRVSGGVQTVRYNF